MLTEKSHTIWQSQKDNHDEQTKQANLKKEGKTFKRKGVTGKESQEIHIIW